MAEVNTDNNSQDVKYLKNQLNIARNEINNLRYVFCKMYSEVTE